MRNHQPLRAALRKSSDILHRWLGFSVGAIFVIGGLTGTMLAFYVEIEHRLYPHMQTPSPRALPSSYEAVYQRLAQLPVNPPGQHWRMEIPPYGGVITSRYDAPGQAVRMVSLDPLTLEVLRDARWGRTFFTWIYDLHMNFEFGPPGKVAMGVLALFMVGMLVFGAGNWLLAPGTWRSKFSFSPNANSAKLNYDIHKLSGGLTLPLLLLVAGTGAMINLPNQVRPLLGLLSPLKPTELPPNPAPAPGATRLTVDEALRLGEQVIPGSRAVWIHVPTSPNSVYDLRLRQPNAPLTRFPKTHVFLDQYTGKVVAVNNSRADGLGDWILDWIVPLHDGKAFGMAGRIIVMLLGLVPAVLFLTGFLRWNQKRIGRETGARRRKELAAQ
ncbi:MAG: PepSY-associated TM helix domain-containing protein [Acidobacteria bacterium]|nr:PepSY-associated TM helix domain-containing protein [Acidobacteriota bacterium]